MKLTCHKDLIMTPAALSGKAYTVINDTGERIAILDDQGDKHWFDKDPGSLSYFGHWFDIDAFMGIDDEA